MREGRPHAHGPLMSVALPKCVQKDIANVWKFSTAIARFLQITGGSVAAWRLHEEIRCVLLVGSLW